MARVLVSPLNWGLGHATRDIPIIREFLKNGHDVTLAASGRALEFLRQEFPQCRFIDFPDYKPPYTKSKWFVAYFALNLPFLLRAIASERRRAKKIIEDGRFDLVVSDNRFGVYHRNVPSYFISHQLMFNLPKYIKQAERLTKWFNSYHHLNFDGVIVPDFEGKNNLSGKLSHFHKRNPEVYYAGILTSVEKKKAKEDIDCLFMISGPEPQRTEFEKIVMSQIGRIKGKKVILLGTPEKKSKKVLEDGTLVLSHASRKDCSELMNRSRLIISRSGYTTVMEIAELGKKALFVPTPGQTEQEYLSGYYETGRLFHSVSQYDLDLARDIKIAQAFKGFPEVRSTKWNVRKLYDKLFRKHLG